MSPYSARSAHRLKWGDTVSSLRGLPALALTACLQSGTPHDDTGCCELDPVDHSYVREVASEVHHFGAYMSVVSVGTLGATVSAFPTRSCSSFLVKECGILPREQPHRSCWDIPFMLYPHTRSWPSSGLRPSHRQIRAVGINSFSVMECGFLAREHPHWPHWKFPLCSTPGLFFGLLVGSVHHLTVESRLLARRV